LEINSSGIVYCYCNLTLSFGLVLNFILCIAYSLGQETK
jgi:hypothetical protein